MNKKLAEYLLQLNWFFFADCTCNGIYTAKYRHHDHPGWQVNIQPGYNKWLVFNNSEFVKDGRGELELKEYIATI